MGNSREWAIIGLQGPTPTPHSRGSQCQHRPDTH
nr:MAG TPA: hypothetical protein [Caudoviricetes sp.]